MPDTICKRYFITVNSMEFDMKTLILMCLSAGLALAPAAQAEVYRWVDENGEVHYSETLPPNFQDKKHDVLDSQGITRETDLTLAPPPPEPKNDEEKPGELPRDSSGMKRPDPLYTPQQLRKQQNDLLLLRYDSDQEILDAMAVEINQLDYDRRLLQTSRTSLVEAYDGNVREAAERQRAGLKVEPQLSKDVQNLKVRLQNNTQSLAALEARELSIRETFESELERYRTLVAAMNAAREEEAAQRAQNQD